MSQAGQARRAHRGAWGQDTAWNCRLGREASVDEGKGVNRTGRAQLAFRVEKGPVQDGT